MITVFTSELLAASDGRWYNLSSREKQRVVQAALRRRGDQQSLMQANLMNRGNPIFQNYRVVSDQVQT